MELAVNFLAIDTSTDMGLVVLKYHHKVYARVQREPREHNRFLLAMITEVLHEAGIELTALDAMVCGNGPGSFVGVRLGVAVVQGLAYGAQKPVYVLSSLALQAQAFFRVYPKCQETIIAHDARMQALYLGHYRNHQGLAEIVAAERLVHLKELAHVSIKKDLSVTGNAAQLLASQATPVALPELKGEDLEAQALLSIHHNKKLSASELQPVYLNDKSNWQKTNQKVEVQG